MYRLRNGQAGRVENYPVLRARLETHITETQLAGMVAADEIVWAFLLFFRADGDRLRDRKALMENRSGGSNGTMLYGANVFVTDEIDIMLQRSVVEKLREPRDSAK